MFIHDNENFSRKNSNGYEVHVDSNEGFLFHSGDAIPAAGQGLLCKDQPSIAKFYTIPNGIQH